MEAIPILDEIAVVAVTAVFVTVLIGRAKVPAVAGLLVSGALIGPHGLAVLSDTHAVEMIAEVGVVLLLFSIGLEFSLKRLKLIFRSVALSGILQVGGTLVLAAAVAMVAGATTRQAVFYGFVFALSSTAIVLRALSVRRELDAPHGRIIVGALIFQDLCVVPMVLIVPLLGAGGGSTLDIAAAIVKAAGVVVAVLALSRLFVPRMLDWVEASRSREVFLLAVLAACVGTAWMTAHVGLSLALGAFLGGMVVADTEHSHRAMGDILPLRDVFLSFFFVSLGTFFDVRVLLESPLLVALLLAGFILGKGAVATGAALLVRFPPRVAWLAGAGLAQFGEFGFVLVQLGLEEGVVREGSVSPLLCAGIISMFATPILLQLAPHMTAGERLLSPLAKLLRVRTIEGDDTGAAVMADHVVIVGYGVAGRLASASLRTLGVAHLILELNAENVRRGRAIGDPVFYGDGTSPEALRHANVAGARCVVIMIDDPMAIMRVVGAVRAESSGVSIIVRTRYLAQRDEILDLGGSAVVAEEVEGGLEILARVLRVVQVPRNLIDTEISRAREHVQNSERALTVPRTEWPRSALSSVKVECALVVEGSAADSKTLRELDLRAQTGALLVAVGRDGEVLPHPGPEHVFSPGEVAYLLGDSESVLKAVRLFG